MKNKNDQEKRKKVSKKRLKIEFTIFNSDKKVLDVTNFIQLVSPQPVDQFSQTKLHWKAPNKSYLHICGIYKSNNK